MPGAWTAGALAAALIGSTAPALAATAHNSQAGAWGPNSHPCDPTPYFSAGGCASAALIGEEPFVVGPEAPHRAGRRLTAPTGPLPVLPPTDE